MSSCGTCQGYGSPVVYGQGVLGPRPIGRKACPDCSAEVWVEWKGGACPVEANALVDIRLRDGRTYLRRPASNWMWAWNVNYMVRPNDCDGDIVAFRLLPQNYCVTHAVSYLEGEACLRCHEEMFRLKPGEMHDTARIAEGKNERDTFCIAHGTQYLIGSICPDCEVACRAEKRGVWGGEAGRSPNPGGVTWVCTLCNQPKSKLDSECACSGSKPTTGIEDTLAQRGKRYGAFTGHARITQNIKRAMIDSPNYGGLSDDKKEALEMFAHKIGRILNGDPEWRDSWHDIAGYAKLVADTLEEVPDNG